jgi:hypothetical protein
MNVPKDRIVEFLRAQGKAGLADQAEQHLPEQVDVQQYAEKLQEYGIDVPTLVAKLPGPLGALGARFFKG